ncbi:hypothetical protein AMECASPLE_005327 [Ameca splendens]|uniref:Uncharacterized protein n=1 Tax=Ameca splendens TaxID=208324 RepID=A0ABV0YX27_9TELE
MSSGEKGRLQEAEEEETHYTPPPGSPPGLFHPAPSPHKDGTSPEMHSSRSLWAPALAIRRSVKTLTNWIIDGVFWGWEGHRRLIFVTFCSRRGVRLCYMLRLLRSLRWTCQQLTRSEEIPSFRSSCRGDN